MQTRAVLALLARYGGAAGMRAAGRRRLLACATKASRRGADDLVAGIWTALGEQTVVVPGTAAADTVLRALARFLADILAQRAELARHVEQALDAHPLGSVLTSMPGIGVGTGARILLEVGDASSFPTAGHLASYAGLAPVTRRSGSSIRGEHQPGWEQTPQERHVHGRVRSPGDPRLPRLLRPQTRRGQESTTPPSSASPDAAATSSTPCSATTPLPSNNPRRRLTHIGTPLTA